MRALGNSHCHKNYLIGANVIIETDCLLVLGIIANCDILDQVMLRWCIYIKSVNPEVRHNHRASQLKRRNSRKQNMIRSLMKLGNI